MASNPPRWRNNPDKFLKTSVVGNYYGLVKEYLKAKFPDNVDFEDEYWFTMSKSNIVGKLDKIFLRGARGVGDGGKVSIVREHHDEYIADNSVPDLVAIQQHLLKDSVLPDIYEHRLAVNMLYSADGRAGEPNYINLKSFVYDVGENVFLPIGRT